MLNGSMDNQYKIVLNTFEEYKSLTRNQILNLFKFNYYAIVHHSSKIEGNTLTLEETEFLLDKNLTPKSKPLEDLLMVNDHYSALLYVIELAKNKSKFDLNELKNISSLLMKNSEKMVSNVLGITYASKGDLRLSNLRAGKTVFMNYDKVESKVLQLLDYISVNLNSKNFIEINKLAFLFHYQMVTIHPFLDGNGRLSRLVMNYVQQYHNIPLSYIYANDKLDYYKALNITRENENLEIFYKFMFNQLNKQLKAEIKHLKKQPKIKKNKKGFSLIF